jgi:ketosteroid isomerase-like protein
MLDTEWARAFAQDWTEAWNAHDMERILSHYTDDFEMYSPLIVERLHLPSGTLRGKAQVRAYWEPRLRADPPLKFELINVLLEVDSLTLYYRNVGRRVVAETLVFNASGKAVKCMAQWSLSHAF